LKEKKHTVGAGGIFLRWNSFTEALVRGRWGLVSISESSVDESEYMAGFGAVGVVFLASLANPSESEEEADLRVASGSLSDVEKLDSLLPSAARRGGGPWAPHIRASSASSWGGGSRFS
jgi:hypothetical protein